MPNAQAQSQSVTPRKEVLRQLDIQVIDGFASDDVGHGCDTKVLQQSVTVLATPRNFDRPC